jgi:decaprenylphospho-beta-D-ribofuranose 2-oxidase
MTSKISGWGKSTSSYSDIKQIQFPELELPSCTVRGFVPRGLGRSYGDSATNSGGTALESRDLDRIFIDSTAGVAIVGSGVTIQQIESESLPLGYFPNVVPGTAQVSIGGAIASDIHGKSHHKVGSFSNHIIEIKVLGSDGIVRTFKPEDDSSQHFWATIGGMGLTGMITQATIKLQKIETSYLTVKESRVRNLDELLSTLKSLSEEYLYTVAWIDLSGKFLGRGVVSGANHCDASSLPRKYKSKELAPINVRQKQIPNAFKLGVVNRFTTRIFNYIWFRKPLGKKLQHVQKYMHPLDGISNWNVVYGDRGFIQYQFVIPFDRSDVLKTILIKLRNSKCSSFLSVLKGLGEQSKGLLGFSIPGWTLAIDLPVNNSGVAKVLIELDDLVLKSGGRIYLTKDSRMNPNHLAQMYPNLEEWKKIKSQMDPGNCWKSDQGRRLNLC